MLILTILSFLVPFVFFYFSWAAHKKNLQKIKDGISVGPHQDDVYAWGGLILVTIVFWGIGVGLLLGYLGYI